METIWSISDFSINNAMLVQIIRYLIIFIDLHLSINFAVVTVLFFSGSKLYMPGKEAVPAALVSVF